MLNLDNYATNNIGSFPRFTSTSKNIEVGLGFGTGTNNPNPKFHCNKTVIFKTFISDNNHPATNVDTAMAGG